MSVTFTPGTSPAPPTVPTVTTALLTFRVDLNTIRAGNRVSTLLRHCTSPAFLRPRPGDTVRTVDEDGDEGWATVEKVTTRRIVLRLWSR